VNQRVSVAVAAVLALTATTAPSPAGAEELTLTAQAVAARGEFLTQVAPPETRGVLCLVDSGVDLNPDTEPILVGRESVLEGTGDDVTSYHHGTYVAMVAGAAANGWGMIGAWPHLRILSVRALPEGTEHLSGDAYRAAMLRCVQAKTVRGIDIRVMELALGGRAIDRPESELAGLSDAVAYARQNGIVVVSAAGNDAGALNVPAAVPGVISVGATDRAGALCTFSSRGPDLDVTALGCQMDVTMLPAGDVGVGQSTSLASAYVAGAVTALRSYRPDLTVAQTEELVRGPLDIGAAFRAAGLTALADSYVAPPPAPIPSPAVAPCNPRTHVCTTPRVSKVRRARGRVIIRLRSVPKGVRVKVRVNGKPRRHTTRSRVISVKSRRVKIVSIRFVAKGLEPSPPAVVRPARRSSL